MQGLLQDFEMGVATKSHCNFRAQSLPMEGKFKYRAVQAEVAGHKSLVATFY